MPRTLDPTRSKEVDFLIIIVTSTEEAATLSQFPGVRPWIGKGNRTYFAGAVPSSERTMHRIAIVRALDQGHRSMVNLVKDSLEETSPRYVILVGTAGGIRKGVAEALEPKTHAAEEARERRSGKHVGLGTVIVSKQVFYVPFGTNVGGDFKLEFLPWASPSSTLRQRALDVVTHDPACEWASSISPLRPVADGGRPNVVEGELLSGETLEKEDPERLKALRTKYFPDALAVDMEAGAVASVLYESGEETRCKGYLVIRGVSDMVNVSGMNDDATRDRWREYAAASAVAFVREMLSLTPPERRSQNAARLSALQDYLARLKEGVGLVKMSHVYPDQPEGIPLERIYIPSPTNLMLGLEIRNESISRWWIESVPITRQPYSYDIGKWDSEGRQFNCTVIDRIIEKADAMIKGTLEPNFPLRDRPLIMPPIWADQLIPNYYRLEAIDVAASINRLVVLGEPGSGKSTFAKYLALTLLVPQLQLKVENTLLAGSDYWPNEVTPIFVELAHFVRWKHFPKLEKEVGTEDFLRYVKEELAGNDRLAMSFITKDLNRGNAVIILDGLDEIRIPEVPQNAETLRKTQIHGLVRSLETRFPACHIVVTSRSDAYGRWFLPGFRTVTLTELDTGHKERLAANLFSSMQTIEDTEGVSKKVKELMEALKTVPGDLSDRPLFFTLLAILFLRNQTKGAERLPTKRGVLIREYIDLLLERWAESRRSGESLIQQLGCSSEQLFERLEKIAFRIQSGAESRDAPSRGGPGPIIELGIILEEFFELGSGVNPHVLLEYVTNTAGILESPSPREFRFAYRMFQEFMAASYLAKTALLGEIRELIENDYLNWREVCLLVGDALYRYRDRPRLWEMVDSIIANVGDTPGPDSPSWNSLWLASRIFEEQALGKDAMTPARTLTTQRLRHQMKRLLTVCGALSPVDRVDVAVALGVLGDDRPGVGVVGGVPDISWCEIPSGEVTIGTSDQKRGILELQPWSSEWKYSRETPSFSCRVPRFLISRYPVTQAQFQAFRDAADGYRNDEWWTAEGLKWRSIVISGGEDSNRGSPNSPAVNVSWYEASAFCNWMAYRTGRRVRLPTEPEWEKAARGTDERVFPWGDEFSRIFCNAEDTGIGFPSPVGCFPFPNPPWGEMTPLDMAGNVWEWCSTICELKGEPGRFPYPYDAGDGREASDASDDYFRVVRGGCYSNKPFLVRVSYRGRDSPSVQLPYQGFRVGCDAEREDQH
jgi:formylglycine-generating enzyme required for sulfatase activity/nucleoside phosphorylase